MATAYAALLSLINTISMERTSGPFHPPIPFDASLIDALLGRVDFFVECLEQGWKGAEHLESQITDLAYAAEDAIESPIVDTVLSRLASSSYDSRSVLTCQDLEKIIQDMDSIKEEMMENRAKDLDLTSPNISIGSTSGQRQEKNKMVGFEEERIRIMDELQGVGSSRKVISIHGMGGSGKTTLARTVYDHQRIVEYFDVRAWVTVSQEYTAKELLKQILSCLKTQGIDEMDEYLLGQTVYQSLFDRRYLVILDDIWDIDAWDKIRRFFPDNSNGSRIILTTRLFNLANDASTCSFEMKPLDEENSWKLLCEKVFGQGSCPDELEEVGKWIAQNCRGLPLAIAVIGGLLAKSNLTLQYWNGVAKDLNSFLSDDDYCSKILSLSYNHLPIYLKPCFLYMGIFPEDHTIFVRQLTHLWIAEGFIKSHGEKILEEIPQEYLKDLIERNLIIMGDSFIGLVEQERECKIHDLLRELCMKEAQRDCFFCVVNHNSHLSVLLSLRHQRRLVVQLNEAGMRQDIVHRIIDCLPSMSHVRSLILNSLAPSLQFYEHRIFKLLRILFVINDRDFVKLDWEGTSTLFNLRYLKGSFKSRSSFSNFMSNNCLFRNMQMQEIDFYDSDIWLGFDIWNWPQLRYLNIPNVSPLELQSSPQEDNVILGNLQTISGVANIKLDEAACKRISKVKTLILSYNESPCEFMIHNLPQLQKLETLGVNLLDFHLEFCCPQHGHFRFLHDVVVPYSLKALFLAGTGCSWEDMSVIGLLPNLEILGLAESSFTGLEWNPMGGEFLHLKVLIIVELKDLVYWNVDCTHFPVLQELYLIGLHELREVPLDIGEIPTLRSISLEHCSDGVDNSAKKILHQQRSLGNHTLVLNIDDKLVEDSYSDEDEDGDEEERSIEGDEEEDGDEEAESGAESDEEEDGDEEESGTEKV